MFVGSLSDIMKQFRVMKCRIQAKNVSDKGFKETLIVNVNIEDKYGRTHEHLHDN